MRMRWVRHVASMGPVRSEYNISVGKPEGKNTWRLGHRWDDNIKMDLKGIG
jgi:hypothetical protein